MAYIRRLIESPIQWGAQGTQMMTRLLGQWTLFGVSSGHKLLPVWFARYTLPWLDRATSFNADNMIEEAFLQTLLTSVKLR
ncbi:hypothetical protein WAI453_010850 [Rhynchosporium graminicola]